ncbi:hypothetical protein B0H34DRAFT_736978 [Crassisporium funariophilum]|nr:hypothetical protein B0H34DRAFT_736978 [Crassisporium funariophilum]
MTPRLESRTVSTAYWMHKRFGAPPKFFQSLTSWLATSLVKTGNTSFIRRDPAGKVATLDSINYFSYFGQHGHVVVSHIWSSRSLVKNEPATYIIHACPRGARDHIVHCANGKSFRSLLRPFAIDAFIAEDCLHVVGKFYTSCRREMVTYEHKTFGGYTASETGEAVERLHNLSLRLHFVQESLTNMKETLNYLLSVYQRCMDLSQIPFNNVDSVAESLELQSSQTSTISRCVGNYIDRVGIRINLFFNLGNQVDSRINLKIARLTSKIAVASQRDSSSMITVAAVTMFSLPGTFVSALFSMVFFNFQSNSNGESFLALGPQWWLFPLITIPLTIVVFGTWIFWQRNLEMNVPKLPDLEVGEPVARFVSERSKKVEPLVTFTRTFVA